MNLEDKIAVLGQSAKYDVCASTSCRASGNVSLSEQSNDSKRIGALEQMGVCHSYLPDGRCVSLFKVLLSNFCERHCLYCPNRRDMNTKRAKFTKEELAKAFVDLYRANYVEGLFLSSGIFCSPDTTMSEMLDVCTIIRTRYHFAGYIHLKILPGVSDAHVEAAMRIATRVSLNLEAPNADHMKKIAPDKNFHKEIISRLTVIDKNIRAGNNPNAGVTTQFIVGAAGENDYDILRTTDYLYRKMNLRRAYFSAFVPQPMTPLEGGSRIPLEREHRLYQADWLLRRYSFGFGELTFSRDGTLPLHKDPKEAWADAHPERFPVEVNKATHEELLRVPGIGEVSRNRIVAYRKEATIRDAETLKRMGVIVRRALAYLLLDGKKLRSYGRQPNDRQLLLFDEG